MCPYVNDWMTDGELEIFADVRVGTHYIAVLYRLHIFSDLIVKTHGLGSTPIQSITSGHGHVSDYEMCPQIVVVVGSFKFTLPLHFEIIANTLQMLDLSQRLFVSFGQGLSARQRLHVSERLTLAAVIVTSQEFVNWSRLGAVTVHAVMWKFWRSIFATVSRVL